MKEQKNFLYKIIDKDLLKKNYNHIHTRFPPEPNGYLHIGHAKSIYINFNIAKYYNGKFNLRLDDTNPETENIKYVNAIKKDIKWLGFNWNERTKYSSEYFEKIYYYAIDLIKKGLAYVDKLDQELIRKYRGTLKNPGINSPYRNQSIKDNLENFKKMKEGFFKEGQACLRAKIDMSSPFIIMRDPVLYRIKFKKHYRLGSKWCIYPTYDFTHCISDYIEGITHSFCTLEFEDNRLLYDWILNNIDSKSKPKQYTFSRLNLSYTIMSKRKLNKLIEKKIVNSWDDPRMPTISGLRRRGYTADSIKDFCSKIGITKKESIINIELLESCIRKDLNKKVKRVMGVLNPVKLIINNMTENEEKILLIKNHPKEKSLGARKVYFTKELYIDRNDFLEKIQDKNLKKLSIGKKVYLRNAFIIKAKKVKKNKNGEIIAIYCIYYPNSIEEKFLIKKNKKINCVIHWVSLPYAIPAEFRLYEHLFDVYNPNLKKNFISQINKKSLIIKNGFVEQNLINSKPGNLYQFEREGYFCADIIEHNPKKLVFNRTVKLKLRKKNYTV